MAWSQLLMASLVSLAQPPCPGVTLAPHTTTVLLAMVDKSHLRLVLPAKPVPMLVLELSVLPVLLGTSVLLVLEPTFSHHQLLESVVIVLR